MHHFKERSFCRLKKRKNLDANLHWRMQTFFFFFPNNVHLCLRVNLRPCQEYIQNEEEVAYRTRRIGTMPSEKLSLLPYPLKFYNFALKCATLMKNLIP